MNENVKGIELKYYLNNLDSVTDYTRCKLSIDRRLGKVKLGFDRSIKNSLVEGNTYSVQEKYEYLVSPEYLDEKLFSKIDFTKIENEDEDVPLAGCGAWKLTVYTDGKKIKYDGFRPPKEIGADLSELLKGLIDFEKEPLLF